MPPAGRVICPPTFGPVVVAKMRLCENLIAAVCARQVHGRREVPVVVVNHVARLVAVEVVVAELRVVVFRAVGNQAVAVHGGHGDGNDGAVFLFDLCRAASM